MIASQKLDTAELLYRSAAEMGLHPRWLIPSQLFTIDTPMGERYIHQAKSTINSHLSSSLARDKTATRHILEQRGLPGIPFLRTADPSAARRFLDEHTKIVVKPINGSNSRDVRVVESAEQLDGLNLPRYILEKYIMGKEMRYLVLDGRVIGVHRSDYGESVAEDRYLERVSYHESEWDVDLIKLSLQVISIFGLRYGAVDYIVQANGQSVILEVNSSPGMKWFHAPTAGPSVQVAPLFLSAMLRMSPQTRMLTLQ